MTETTHRRLWQLGALTVVVGLGLAIAISVLTGGSAPALVPGRPVPHADDVRTLFAGVPEQGAVLGAPGAPVTLVEFGDLQCPVCAAFAQDALPTLIRREVRRGRLRIVFEPLSVIGPDSTRGARMALAAGEQNRLWPFADLFFANQRDENSGYVTDRFLTALADATPGLNASSALAARSTDPVSSALASASAQAARVHVTATPSFALSRTGAGLVSFSPADLQASTFVTAVDRVAGGGSG